MEYRIETLAWATVVHLRGAMDRSARGFLEMELHSLPRQGINLVIDLSQVDYISSAGLHLLLDLYRRCQQLNGRMALAAPSEPVRAVLTLTGFTASGLEVFDSVDQAVNPPPPTGYDPDIKRDFEGRALSARCTGMSRSPHRPTS